LKLAKYRFVIKPKSELLLPTYKGSTFRGGFGHAFKRAVCADTSCGDDFPTLGTNFKKIHLNS
jgi:hypothetical protein